MKNLEMIKDKKIDVVNNEIAIESIEGKNIIDYLNKCNSREVHFIDVFLNDEHLERFDVYNPGLIQDFYFAWFMCEEYAYMDIEKSNDGIKFILQDGKEFKFKRSNQYYRYKDEAIEIIRNKINDWTDNDPELNFEKTVVEDIYEDEEYKGTKSIITKMIISCDEIDKEYKRIVKILDRAYEYAGNNIPIPIEIDEDQISFEDDSQKLYTKYKVSRI